jgi:hypothetical protein
VKNDACIDIILNVVNEYKCAFDVVLLVYKVVLAQSSFIFDSTWLGKVYLATCREPEARPEDRKSTFSIRFVTTRRTSVSNTWVSLSVIEYREEPARDASSLRTIKTLSWILYRFRSLGFFLSRLSSLFFFDLLVPDNQSFLTHSVYW